MLNEMTMRLMTYTIRILLGNVSEEEVKHFKYAMRFVKYYLRQLGIDINNNKCPFCGKQLKNRYNHLATTRCNCGRLFRNYVDEALRVYSWIEQTIVCRGKPMNGRYTKKYYCTICGYTTTNKHEIVLHVYNEHYLKDNNHHIIVI